MFAQQNLNPNRKEALIRGLALLPLSFTLTPTSGDKIPYRTGWQEESPVSRNLIADDIRSGRAKGYGLRTGEISDGILALDVDGNRANTLLQELSTGRELPQTVAFTSGLPGKCQYLLQVPQQYWNTIATRKFKTKPDEKGRKQQVELRWNSCQSLLPPSVHPTTGEYKWVKGCSPWECEIAEAPTWLIELMLLEQATNTEARSQSNTTAEIGKAKSYLAALSSSRADDYDEWLAVGMALHSVDDSLLKDWDDWSKQSSKYKPGDCLSKWDSFKRKETDRRITVATLALWATTDGWQSSAKSNRFSDRIGGGDGNPPISNITLADRVKEILNRAESQAARKSAFISLAGSTKVPLRELEQLAEAIEGDADTSLELADAKISLPKLLETQNQTIDPSDYLWGDGGKLAEAIKTVASAMPTSAAMIFTTFIPASASRIGVSSRIIIKPSARYKQPCIFWAGIVARSGQLKTPAQSVAIDPLIKLEIDSKKAYDKALQEYEEAKQDWQEGDPKPEKPQPRQRYITKDATLETLESIHSSNPRGILYYRDELAGMHKSRNAFKANGAGADLEAELDQWNGGPSIVDRKQREIAIDRTAISRTGSIQYEILQSLAGDHLDSNGNMARWLFCAVKAPPRYINFDDAPDTGISELLETLYRNLEKLPTQDYLINKDAQNVFKVWQHLLVDTERQENHPGLKLLYPKIEAYTARFALWLHCVNAILAGETPQASIDGTTMQKAVQLSSFYLEQAKLLYAVNSPQFGLTGRLLKIYQFAEGKLQGITPRDVKRNLNGFKKVPTSEIKQDFSTLVEAGNFQVKGDRFIVVADVGDLSVVPPTAKTLTYNEIQSFVGGVGAVGGTTTNNQPKNLKNDFKKSPSNANTSPKPSKPLLGTDTTDTTDKIARTLINNNVESVAIVSDNLPTGTDITDNLATGSNNSPSGGSSDNSLMPPTGTDNSPTGTDATDAYCQIENQKLSISNESNAQQLAVEYYLVTDAQALTAALNPLAEAQVLGIDLETSRLEQTSGLDPHQGKIRLIQIAAPNQPVVIVDLAAIAPSDLEPLRQLLTSPAVKIGHNFKFEWKFLTKAGLQPQGPIFDTMLASQLITAGLPGTHSLKAIALQYLGIQLDKESQQSDWSGELSTSQLEYAARDASILLQLREVMKPKLVEAKLVEAAQLEFETIPAVAEMQLTGMQLDRNQWEALTLELQQAKKEAAAKLGSQLSAATSQTTLFEDCEAINPDSPSQVLAALKEMGIPVKSTDKNSLIPLSDSYPVVKAVLEYRKLAKAVSFTEKLPEHINSVTGRIHPDYHQYGCATGRFSCNKPNLQQVPREDKFRSCFIPSPNNKLVIADYSQIELRVAAEISGDRKMIEAYQQKQDLHRLTAALVNQKPLEEVTKEERQSAKAINFGLVYGCGSAKLRETAENQYNVSMLLSQAEAYRKQYFASYKGIAKWHSHLKRDRPMEIRTLSNRRRQWSETPWLTATSNSAVQGTAADIAKKALAMLRNALAGTGAKIIAAVHDEIILECPQTAASEAAKILQEVMVKAGEFYLKQVPVEVEVKVADSWADK